MDFFNSIALAKNAVLEGLYNTLAAGGFAIVFGSFIGVIFGYLLAYGNKIVKFPIRIYVDLVRGIPGLVTIFTVFYLLDFILRRFGIVISTLLAGMIALSIPCSAQTAEITRGALENINKGQREAGMAIGMRFSQIFVNILLPQALVQMLPPWINSATEVIKGTTLLMLIGISELLLTTQQLVGLYGNALSYYMFIGLIFLTINTGLEYFGKWLEQKLNYYGR